MNVVVEALNYIRERLLQAQRVRPDTDYKAGFRDGSVNELEVLEEYLEEEMEDNEG